MKAPARLNSGFWSLLLSNTETFEAGTYHLGALILVNFIHSFYLLLNTPYSIRRIFIECLLFQRLLGPAGAYRANKASSLVGGKEVLIA